MKKNLSIILGVLFGLSFSTLSVFSFERKGFEQVKPAVAQDTFNTTYTKEKAEFVLLRKSVMAAVDSADMQDTSSKNNNSSTIIFKGKDTGKAAVSTKSANVSKKTAKSTSKTKSSSSRVELLDWWKSARYVFSTGTVAEVTDIKTGKTFKIKRTMGTNHADCEALTKKDTEIIKSIWGGFSWDVRPVIVKVGDRRLAASMSAMPHAGVDSAPAYAVVNRRSGGYNRGENLDVVKGNGMNGHFDVHFLNSRRHKDNKKDPRHQAAVLKAAGR